MNLRISQPTAREAVAWARRHYGIEASARELSAEYASNFLLEGVSLDSGPLARTTSGRWVLKVASEELPDESLDLQNRALEHLRSRELPLEIPRLIPSSRGETVVRAEGSGGRTHRLRLLTFLPGTLWVDGPQPGPALLFQLGQALGALDAALADFDHPAADREQAWDLGRAQRLRRHLGEVPDPRQRALLEAAFQLHGAYVTPLSAGLPRSVIHGDANDYNLLLETGGNSARLCGLIDFGDLHRTFTVCDLAVALAYAMMGREDPLAVADTVAGYHRQRPLSEAELEALFPLTCTRLAITALTAARRRKTRPENSYLFVSEGPAWEVLEKLCSIPPAIARDRFRAACDLAPVTPPPPAPEALLRRRRSRIGPSLSLSYRSPLEIVRGRGQFLFSHQGRPYLDLVNNVCHVGHCHPRVVAAACRQMERLNTNTRYLYEGLTDYADRLCATLPEPLSVCFFVCSGSEANELALRLARAHTGRKGLLVLEGAYHGHTTTLIDASPYKFRGPGGSGGAEPWVHPVAVPDGYRGPHKGGGREAGRAYADDVGRALEGSQEPIGAYIAESLLGCGGQIVPPQGYLEEVYRRVRGAGGVCIADEVQVGFGRVGSRFWGFELQGVVPDIVVLGKPIGNGHPMAAVVTTREIAGSFDNGMEFFSTFGGNPVSCAVGLAVLEVVEEEGLQERARSVGSRMKEGFEGLRSRHPLIGDVRGEGLFLGLELVKDRDTLEPAAGEAGEVLEGMKELGILLAIDGPLENVLKIKPPMVLTPEDADMVVRCLDLVLTELGS